MRDFLDVSVWVALVSVDHEHHRSATHYLAQERSDDVAFCWASAMGLVRVTTSLRLIKGDPIPPDQAWNLLQEWLDQDGVLMLAEPSGIRSQIDRWVTGGFATSRNWTDLYLAAFALLHGLRMVTFDRGIARLPGLTTLLLT